MNYSTQQHELLRKKHDRSKAAKYEPIVEIKDACNNKIWQALFLHDEKARLARLQKANSTDKRNEHCLSVPYLEDELYKTTALFRREFWISY